MHVTKFNTVHIILPFSHWFDELSLVMHIYKSLIYLNARCFQILTVNLF